MANTPANPLEKALNRLAEDTWIRLRDIKAFSQRPDPFNSVRLGETTITDLAMLDLCRQGLTKSIFLQTPQHKESFWGTDFEWWLGSAATGWFRLAVQAKKLDMRKNRYLNPNPPKGACGRPPEEVKGCTFESEIMVLNQKTCHRKGAPNRCYHVTTLTASKSPSTIPAW